MKSMPAPLKAWLDTNQARWWGDLYTISLYDGTKLRWTSADVSITYGGFTYATTGASGPAIKRGPYQQGARLTVDTMDVTLTGGAYQIGGKSLPQLSAQGYFDFARIQIDHLTGADLPGALALGPIPSLFEGPIAGLDLMGPNVILRAKSDLDTLANLLLPKFPLQPQCGNAVYDANCGLNRATFTLTGTASGTPTRSTVPTASAALTAKAAGYFELGVLAFTSGVNSGSRRAVKTWASNIFTLSLPFTTAPAAGDAVSVYPGCSRSDTDCGPTGSGGKFNNLVQFRGYPRTPSTEGAA